MPRSKLLLCSICGLLAAGAARAQQDVDSQLINQQIQQATSAATAATERKDPRLDPKRIINESSSFLKEREPEMTAEEYALYERVVTMLGTRPEFALKLLEAMMNEKEPPSPAFQFILGNAYFATGDNAKSETNYQAALKRYPTFLRAWSNLGILYYSTQRYSEAIRCFSKCISLGDREPSTYGLLGFSLEQENKIVSAEMAYMQAMSGDPENTDWLEGLLRIYVQGKQYGRAEWLVKDLIRQRPADTRFWLAYADILMNQNRKVEALAMLEVCVGSGVAGAAELEQLAAMYAEQRLVPEAIDTYQKLMRTTPQLGEKRMLNYGEVLVSNGQLDQASRVYSGMAGKVSPGGMGNYRLAQADLLTAQKKFPQARAELDTLLQVEPLNGRALLALGRVYLAENNAPRAQFAFEAANQIPDSTYRASLELANLELKNRHYDKTVQYLERALTIEKTVAVQDLLARVRPLVSKAE